MSTCSLELSIEEFVEFCKNSGLEKEKDHQKLRDEGITPKALIELTPQDIKGLNLTLGGKGIIQKIQKDLKQNKNADDQTSNQGAPKIQNLPWCMDAFMAKPREQGSSSNETRSAAAQSKYLWPSDGTADGITLKVKFLNPIPSEWKYRGGGLNFETIMSLAKEWEKDGTPIKFIEEEGIAPAHIRVEFIDLTISHEKLLLFFEKTTAKELEKHFPILHSEDSMTQLTDRAKFREYLKVYADQNPTWEDVATKLQSCGLQSEAKDVKATYIEARGASCSYVGSRAQSVSPTKPSMWLNLSGKDDQHKRHVVIHEFGHALGLEHEHQRPDFWDAIRKYINIDAMVKDKDLQGNREWLEDLKLKSAKDLILSKYDSQSIMHYWFKSSWLKADFDSEEKVEQNKDLKDEEKDALLGIHRCSMGILPTVPSQGDLDHLKTLYGKKESLGIEPRRDRTESDYAGGDSKDQRYSPRIQGKTVHVNQGTISSHQGVQDFDHFKVENRFLRRIEWQTRGSVKQINIYRKSSKEWMGIGQELGLDDGELAGIKNDSHDNEERVRKVLAKWLTNASNLKNSRDYPLTWSALITLLDKSDLGDLSKEVHEALSAPFNTVRGNMN